MLVGVGVGVSDGSGVGTWQEAAGGGIGGNGLTNYIPKFIASTILGNSIIYETGGNVGIGTTSPSEKLEVNGTVKATSFLGDGSNLTGIVTKLILSSLLVLQVVSPQAI